MSTGVGAQLVSLATNARRVSIHSRDFVAMHLSSCVSLSAAMSLVDTTLPVSFDGNTAHKYNNRVDKK